MRKYLVTSAFLMVFFYGKSQEKIIDTVQLYDNQLNDSKKINLIKRLSSDDINKNTTNLSEVLRFQSPIYIKENGRGMVSSPSFRGTTAQQTAFIWNGININSILLGQGDINNINLLSYNNISIKSGGGSVKYGSGAIGGTIHLNNNLKFNEGLKNIISLEYGSFATKNTIINSSYSNNNLSVELNANYSGSDNDYKVPQKKYENINGKYFNQAFNINTAYKINSKNTLYWITQLQNGLQYFPISSPTQIKTKYQTNSLKSLIFWNYRQKKINNYLRLAYLEDEYGYFSNIEDPKTSGAITKVFIVKNDFDYQLLKNLNINVISEFHNDAAVGYNSGIGNPNRNIYSFAGIIKYMPTEKLHIETGIKKDFVEDIATPTLFSLGLNYRLKDWYEIKANVSNNFRYPSFNDLYWQPGGNLALKSETSYQGEIINVFGKKNFQLTIAPYYIRIYNLIRWLPTSADYWGAVNTNNVRSYGIESYANYNFNIRKHYLKFNLGYLYTNSKDLDTNFQLIYTPFHKIFGGFSYDYKFWGLYLQGMYNGLTYSTSNQDYSTAIKPYYLLNSGIYFQQKNYKITFKINNITNQIYNTTTYYYMPKRNYSINLNINF